MNIKLFNKLMEKAPAQHPAEWLIFLELCEVYLKKYDIKNPVVVELGVLYNRQKVFYEQLLGAEHIGIDITNKRSTPDILGDTHNPETLENLKKKLNDHVIDILYIDADHSYEAVKRDFEMYEPLCKGIVALNDIETGRYKGRRSHQVWRFWDELRERSFLRTGGLEKYLFLSIHQCRFRKKRDSRLGTGMMIKKWI